MSEPPSRCQRHEAEPAPGPCGTCGDARAHRAEWERQAAAVAQKHAQTEAKRLAELKRLDIERCAMCGPDGYVGTHLCRHDPEGPARTRAGIDRARQALREALSK